jgi:ferritin-like metal-binding protein YciE
MQGVIAMNELNELLLDELGDILYAENLLVKALPKMAKAAQSDELRDAFNSHLEETQSHVDRIKQVFESFGKPAKSKKCDAMVGLLDEGKKIMGDWKGSAALDAALICAAQKVEHYEIASYGCLCTWAELLGNDDALSLLKETLSEEEAADESLTGLAEQFANQEASQSMAEEGTKSRFGKLMGGGRRKGGRALHEA